VVVYTVHQLALGGPALPTISGTLVDSLGRGIANYRVSALGHWDPSEAITEVSTVDFTDTAGAFSIALSDQEFAALDQEGKKAFSRA